MTRCSQTSNFHYLPENPAPITILLYSGCLSNTNMKSGVTCEQNNISFASLMGTYARYTNTPNKSQFQWYSTYSPFPLAQCWIDSFLFSPAYWISTLMGRGGGGRRWPLFQHLSPSMQLLNTRLSNIFKLSGLPGYFMGTVHPKINSSHFTVSVKLGKVLC